MTQLGMRLPIAQLAEHPTAGSVWKAKHLTNLLLNPHGNSVTFTYYLTIKKTCNEKKHKPTYSVPHQYNQWYYHTLVLTMQLNPHTALSGVLCSRELFTWKDMVTESPSTLTGSLGQPSRTTPLAPTPYELPPNSATLRLVVVLPA